MIDNPIQDIPLIATMTSPIFGFNLDDLSEVRLAQRDVPIYFALKKHIENGDERFLKFVKKIELYRNTASAVPCSKLIEYIYEDTGFPAIVQAMPGGEIRCANLMLLAEYAEKYDGEVCHGLSGFINFMDKLESNKLNLSAAESISKSANVVRIMSIHKSKGLEFPICILAGCARKFNTDNSNLLMHSELGIGFKLKNQNGTIQYNNFIRQAIALQIRKDEISEELRTLYVALTRAKEKLITVLSFKNVDKAIEKSITLCGKQENILPFIVQNSGCFADWILACAYKYGKTKNNWKINIIKPRYNTVSDVISNSIDMPKISQIDAELMEKIKRNFDFKYPNNNLQNIPLKIAASKLAQGDQWKKYIAASRPAFMSQQHVSPADKGTVMHNFLCFANYENAAKNLDDEIKKLIKNKFFTPQEINLIDKQNVEKFLKSDLLNRILKSPKVLKEYRFTVNMPPSELNLCKEKGNTLLVQGAIDCVFQENDGFVIIDYKTDKTNNVQELFDKYSKQLEIYKHAFEQCEGTKIKELIIYSFYLNKFISKFL